MIEEDFPENGQQALNRLMEGNQRFASGESKHIHEGVDWRKKLISG